MAVATLDEVARFVSSEATRRNGKIVPKLPKAIEELCYKPRFYVFNVGPWAWDRQLGGKGTKVLQACEEGAAYSEPLTFGLLDNETVAVDMNKMENRQEDGMEAGVNAFLHRGRDCRPENSLEQWGIGVAEEWPPSAQDLAAANKRLDIKSDELIRDADKFYEQRQYDNIVDTHRWAARRRKLTKGWLNENPDLQPCPACGSQVMPNIAVCPQCSATLDETLARKYFPERFKKTA